MRVEDINEQKVAEADGYSDEDLGRLAAEARAGEMEARYDRLTFTFATTRSELEQLQGANQLLRRELAIYKERSDVLHALCMYAYHRSSEALMMPPSKPREARQAREQAICDINKKIGGALR